jgi:poly(3-hydroxybutyrate) depolymerase
MRELAALLLAATFASAQPGPRTGAQIATFRSNIDDSTQQYALYVPKSFSSAKNYPLLISLHAEESNHRLDLRRIFGVISRMGEPDTEDMRYFPPVHDVEFLIACPLARGTMGYTGIPEQDVYDVIADVESRWPVDRDRVYLTGISMGAAGALHLALTRPDVWAAVAALCPAAVPPGTEELVPNALNLPIRIFQGEQDPIVAPASSRAWQRRFLDAGDPAGYIEYPAVRHNVWEVAYRDGAIFEWFAAHRRNPAPERVRFATSSYHYSSAYWLKVDGLTPGTLASVDASWSSKTALAVETKNVDGFTVSLGPLSPAVQVGVSIDGEALKVRSAAKLAFMKAAGHWRAGQYVPAGKRPGAEGPIVDAVSARHIYVYGTRGASPEEQEARRAVAEAAARWSTARSRLALSLPVKADSAVTAADLDSDNLVLFGNSETNSIIARIAAQLPLELHPGAADYGLLFIAPVGKHYALVSSGLPWWTGSDETPRGGDPFAPAQDRLLSTFGDYVLFKGSLSNVVAEGRFDRNWKLPPDGAAKMSATGTVSVR